MSLKLITWNINSVRLRIGLVEKLMEEQKPDVLCLQETKCPNDQFPTKAFKKMGYEHMAINGQKGYHGVAIISRLPLKDIEMREYCEMQDTRHVSACFEAGGKTLRVHNFYVPAGGDEPNVETNPKFDHKMKFLEEMKALHADKGNVPAILVGDLNIAPYEHDVWDTKKLKRVVSHTPIERETLLDVAEKGEWVDLMRQDVPMSEKLYTWWSYRAKDWDAADKGRRLDHVWSSKELVPAFTGVEVMRDARGWEKPSDHAPVVANFKF
jgi:exodeoxyribonuclease-3